MAEDSSAPQGLEAEVAALQGRIRKLLILLMVSIVLALGAGAYAFVASRGAAHEIESVRAEMQKAEGEGGEHALPGVEKSAPPVGVIHTLGSFVVNLMDADNVRYLSCKIELELEDEALIEAIKAREAQFKDTVISLLGAMSYQDVLGPEGKSRVREELLVRFNRQLDKGQVARVYLTEFVVQ
jgi:flagellar FliL protein